MGIVVRLFWLLKLSLVVTLVNAIPVAQQDLLETNANLDDILEARGAGSGPYPVKGISGDVYPRLEVRTMYSQNSDQWNLYLLAMQRFKLVSQDSMLSYYQIAGIHGVPNVAWNGVNANPSSNGAVGYCTHQSVLFPSWHRPFLAAFEQIMMKHVKQVVKSFPSGPTRKRYANAAKTMRMPYWDWAVAPSSGQSTFPTIFTDQYVSVNTPNGQKSIPNPLYRYSFHPLDTPAMLYTPWSQWPTTLRWPDSQAPTANSQNDQATAAIENGRINLRDTLYNMFVNCNDYLAMSNTAQGSATAACSTSLEGVHDGIHGLVGGPNNGHMTYLWWSAFDPVFWLHHTNVDRLFAMWQAIYPTTYGAYQYAPGSTFTIAQGDLQGPNSPLTPFYADSSGNFWTTNTVRQWQQFGYNYPEFINSDGSAGAIRAYVNQLYGPGATATAGSTKVKRALDLDLSLAVPPEFAKKVKTSDGANYEYVANVVTPKFALNGSYSVYLFMGGPSSESDASGWSFDKSLIGAVRVLSQPGAQHNSALSTGSVPLTRALTSILVNKSPVAGKVLKDLDKSEVVPFLQTALQWRIATSDQRIISASNIPGFEVSVVTSEAQPPASIHDFPKYKPFSFLPDITNGRKGGLKFGKRAACDNNQ